MAGRETRRERFALILMGSFAAVSLPLAALGLYGVLGYSVRQRTREISVRIALRATAAQIRQLVLRQTTLFPVQDWRQESAVRWRSEGS